MPDQGNDLFNEGNKDNAQQKETPPNEQQQGQSPDYNQMLGMIVNADGKQKYNTVEELIKGTVHAQAHIGTLESELSQYKANEGSSKKVEDIIAALQSQQDSDQKPADNGQSALSATDIQDLVKNAVQDINSQSTQEQNIKQVTGKFKELYGDKASEILYSKAEDLGMSKEDINGLIAKSPTAAFRMLGIDNKSTPSSSITQNSVNSTQFQEKGDPKPESSMGYITTKKLTSNWLDVKKRTNERLNS